MISTCVLVRRKVYVYIVIISCLYLALHFKLIQNMYFDLYPRTDIIRCDRGRCMDIQYLSNTMKEKRIRKIFDKKSSWLADTDKSIPLVNGKSVMDIIENISSINKERNTNKVMFSPITSYGKLKRKNIGLQNGDLTSFSSGKLDIMVRENKNDTFDKPGTYVDQHTSISNYTTRQTHPANMLRKRIVPQYPNVFKPPLNEEPIRRFPQSVIIGFAKCGTRAILEFLSLHPYIVTHRSEMHFYDRAEVFEKGFEWYKNQMPLSYSNQITIEKTPAYILYQRARDEIYKLTPDMKLIVLVRDPVVRLVSHFMLRYRNILPFKDVSVTAIYRDKETSEFNPDYKPVVVGIYYKHLKMWLERFPRKQFLILNGEELSNNPLNVMKQVEKYLGIPSMFTEWNFYFNKTSGFFCPRGFEDGAIPECLGKLKGVSHPKLPEVDEKMLYEFYKPFNEKFFQLVGQRFQWNESEWARYQ